MARHGWSDWSQSLSRLMLKGKFLAEAITPGKRAWLRQLIRRMLGTPKEHLRVHRRNDLKSELGGLLSEPQFRPFQSLLFTLVESGFAVRFSRAKQVKDDARQLVCNCGNCLGLAELACDAPKEITDVIFGMVIGLRTHTQRSSKLYSERVCFSCLTLCLR